MCPQHVKITVAVQIARRDVARTPEPVADQGVPPVPANAVKVFKPGKAAVATRGRTIAVVRTGHYILVPVAIHVAGDRVVGTIEIVADHMADPLAPFFPPPMDSTLSLEDFVDGISGDDLVYTVAIEIPAGDTVRQIRLLAGHDGLDGRRERVRGKCQLARNGPPGYVFDRLELPVPARSRRCGHRAARPILLHKAPIGPARPGPAQEPTPGFALEIGLEAIQAAFHGRQGATPIGGIKEPEISGQGQRLVLDELDGRCRRPLDSEGCR